MPAPARPSSPPRWPAWAELGLLFEEEGRFIALVTGIEAWKEDFVVQDAAVIAGTAAGELAAGAERKG